MRTPALEFHDVVALGAEDASGFAGPAALAYKVTPATFEHQLALIGELVGGLAPDMLGPWSAEGPSLLTFDDGGISALTEIAPRLESRGWRGHFFITTGSVGRRGFLAPAQLRELHERGHRLGSHSETHPLHMGRLPGERIAEEWRRSVDRLSTILGCPVWSASVPGGYFRPAVAAEAGRAGIRWLYTSEPTDRPIRMSDVEVLGRFVIRRTQPASFAAAAIEGRRHVIAGERLKWRAKMLLKGVLGDSYLNLRDILRKRMPALRG